MRNFSNSWYLIYTKPCQEKKLAIQLQENEIEYYLPTIKTVRKWHDRKKIIDVPIFPSYVFVNLKTPQHYYNAMNSDGFLYFVKSGKEIAKVKQDTINEIKVVLDHGKDVEVSHEHFAPGQQLIIQKGPLTGLNCQVVEHNNKQKILVRIELLQRSILATLPPACLAPN